ncbi:FKBP-type peptidyl-prolyl cis-trans isomerase [Candidatus Woesearchaeota archaeon]|nr:FKBP-type peptidyl-prolyl cis-trans isomerase [Candidatus Woesearchaeota archaeon]MBW3005196.1 FKBP-type peptidyl-prolyl cis-trans isomerase [Candidatus Woesearchaeota archaeon]
MAKKVKVKKSYVKWALIIAIVIVVAVFLLRLEGQEPEPETNITEIEDMSKVAEPGDLVTINYVMRLDNGKVVDTNDKELAKEAELENYVKGPFKFIVGQSNKLSSFDEAIEGLKLGEKKTIIIEPIEPVLAVTINISDHRPRRILYSRAEILSFKEYNETFPNEPAVANNIISNPEAYPWPLQIMNVTDKYVVTQIQVRPGESFFMPGQEWKSQVMRTSDKVIEFVQNPKVGLIFDTPYGTAEVTNVTISDIYFTHTPEQGKIFKQRIGEGKKQGMTFDFEVLDVDKEDFVIRRTNYLAQELANLEVELVDLQKDVKELE